MSFDAITDISRAEEAAKNAVEFAEAQARQMLINADQDGKAAVAAAGEKAAAELAQLKCKADEKSEEEIGKIGLEKDRLKEGLKEAAQAKLDQAARIIVERIVNG